MDKKAKKRQSPRLYSAPPKSAAPPLLALSEATALAAAAEAGSVVLKVKKKKAAATAEPAAPPPKKPKAPAAPPAKKPKAPAASNGKAKAAPAPKKRAVQSESDDDDDDDESEDDDDDDDESEDEESDDDESESEEEKKPKKRKEADGAGAAPSAPKRRATGEDRQPEEAGGSQAEGELSAFRLSEPTREALRARGVERLFPIQAASFDIIYDGNDFIGRARTGMGKTLAFALPIAERLLALRAADASARAARRPPAALVMAPTRELAQQVATEFSSIAPSLVLLCAYGGTEMRPQVSRLAAGIDVLVGTPGRIKDLAERGHLSFSGVRYAVLDEADQMLDMGFADDMAHILGLCSNGVTGGGSHEGHKHRPSRRGCNRDGPRSAPSRSSQPCQHSVGATQARRGVSPLCEHTGSEDHHCDEQENALPRHSEQQGHRSLSQQESRSGPTSAFFEHGVSAHTSVTPSKRSPSPSGYRV